MNPTNLDEAIAWLENEMKEELDGFKELDEDSALILVHMGLGVVVRNKLGLWQENKLTKHFSTIGIFHPDDMSSVMFKALHRKLNNRTLDLVAEAQMYKEHWENAKES